MAARAEVSEKRSNFRIRQFKKNAILLLPQIWRFNYYYYITKTFRSEVTAHSSTSSCAYPHINMRTYVGGCGRAGAYNLI